MTDDTSTDDTPTDDTPTDDTPTDDTPTDDDPRDGTDLDRSDLDRSDPPRETVSVPTEIELPRLLDFYDLQTEADTGIHEFYATLRDGELTTTRCGACEATHFPPRIVCPECLSDDLSYTALPHEGTLHSFTEVRGTAAIGISEDTPFVAAVVDLGPVRLSARIDDARYEDLSIGDHVTLKVIDIDGPTDQDRVFYRFVPVTE